MNLSKNPASICIYCLAVVSSQALQTTSAIAQTVLPPPAVAQDVCEPTLTLPGTIQAPAYDPFSGSASIEDFELGYQNTSCLKAVTLNAAIGWGGLQPRLNHNGHELSFSIQLAGRDLTSGQSALGEANVLSNGISINLLASQSGITTEKSRLIIPEGQIVPPGYYQLNIPGDLVSGSGVLWQVEGSPEIRAASISIVAEVLAVMRLGVSGCDLSSDRGSGGENTISSQDFASNCQLNLGDPSQGIIAGDARRARINAQANVNFKIAMTSRNGGVLTLAGKNGDGRETETISYRATLEGQGQGAAFDCSSSNCGTSDLITPSSSSMGTDLYFQVRINEADLTQKRAGRYSDTITLIIQPAS